MRGRGAGICEQEKGAWLDHSSTGRTLGCDGGGAGRGQGTWPEASRPSRGNGEPWMFLSKGIPVFL